jgi:hypothetical protein
MRQSVHASVREGAASPQSTGRTAAGGGGVGDVGVGGGGGGGGGGGLGYPILREARSLLEEVTQHEQIEALNHEVLRWKCAAQVAIFRLCITHTHKTHTHTHTNTTHTQKHKHLHTHTHTQTHTHTHTQDELASRLQAESERRAAERRLREMEAIARKDLKFKP